MSDYTKTTNFTAKDSLSPGDPAKLIKGSLFDTEYDAIAIAIATKYDSNDLADQAAAEAGSNNTTLMTPLRTQQWGEAWAGENAAMIADIQALGDPAADTLLGWDDSASAVIGFTLGAGILHAGTALSIDHDAATNFVANEHINHTSVDITAGAGLTGGGDISASRTLNVGAGDGITVNANDVAVDSTVVRTTGAQSIAGIKTFTDGIQLNDGDTLHVGTGDDIAISATGTTGTIDAPGTLVISANVLTLGGTGATLGFFSGAVNDTIQTVTGSKGGNAALDSLITALAAYGLISNNTS